VPVASYTFSTAASPAIPTPERMWTRCIARGSFLSPSTAGTATYVDETYKARSRIQKPQATAGWSSFRLGPAAINRDHHAVPGTKDSVPEFETDSSSTPDLQPWSPRAEPRETVERDMPRTFVPRTRSPTVFGLGTGDGGRVPRSLRRHRAHKEKKKMEQSPRTSTRRFPSGGNWSPSTNFREGTSTRESPTVTPR